MCQDNFARELLASIGKDNIFNVGKWSGRQYGSAAEISFVYPGIARQLFPRAGQDDAAGFQYIAARRYVQGHVGVLLDQ